MDFEKNRALQIWRDQEPKSEVNQLLGFLIYLVFINFLCNSAEIAKSLTDLTK